MHIEFFSLLCKTLKQFQQKLCRHKTVHAHNASVTSWYCFTCLP